MADMTKFESLMQGFGIVTVMNVKIYSLIEGKTYTNNENGLDPTFWTYSGEFLDTLKIA